jgi:hypothetical protein
MKKIYGLLCASVIGFCGYSQTLLTEGFEAGVPPSGWISFDNGVGTAQSWGTSTTAHAGAGAAFIRYESAGATTEDWLVTSQIDLTTANSELRFFTRQAYDSDYASEYRVLVSTASQSTTTDFTLVQAWTESTLNTTFDAYEEKIVDLSAYDGQQIYIAFVLVQNDGDSWYIDDITVAAAPTCSEPANAQFSLITDSGATASWTAGASETAWNIEYGEAGFTQGAGTTAAVSGTPTYNMSNLDAFTAYNFYVQADCGAGDLSTWAGPFSFTTLCPPVSITTFPWTENFDAIATPALPCGWYSDNVNNDAYTWVTSTESPYSGANSMFIRYNSGAAMNDWAYTPELQLTAGTNYRLSFMKKVSSDFYPENLKVAIGNGQAPALMTTQLIDLPGMTNETYEQVAVDFTVPATDAYFIGFHGYSAENMFDILVDDVTIGFSPSCIEPSAIVLDTATDVTAQISWTSIGSATAWDVEYGAPGFVPGNGVPATVNDTLVLLEGLTALTDYEFYVRSNCGGDSSVWVGPFAFSTLCPPVVISSLPWNENFDNTEVPALPCGWTSENTNNDNEEWVSTTSYSNSGDQAMIINYNSSLATNDWAFTPEIELTAGVNYLFSFKYRTSSSYQEKLEVKIGSDNLGSAMSTMLIDFDSIQTSTFTDVNVQFTVPATGSYFIGFHGYSEPNMYYIVIDDVVLDQACSADFTLGQDTICTQSIPVTPQVTGTAGGVFSGSNGLMVDAATGAITPAASTPGAHTLTYVVSSSLCSDTTVMDVVIENCAGIEESVLAQIQLFPNPTNGLLQAVVPFTDGAVEIAVTDFAGKTVLSAINANQNTVQLNLSGLENGVYLVSFRLNNAVETRRVVLNK